MSNVLRTEKNSSKDLLPSTPARTRFAPSPTGLLHLGSLRTALLNYLLAKRTGGQFILRIEDTDQRRKVHRAEERLQTDLQWARLQWDEGPGVGGPYGPYRQSERTAIYRSHARDLIVSDYAYRCFCTPERLDVLARHRNQAGLPAGYDRKCFDISHDESEERAVRGEPFVVRLKVDGYPMFDDIVYGRTGQNIFANDKAKKISPNRVYDDPILLKSDEQPTYHLANVVDDHSMKITHVVRGTEWMASTPMHVALYHAFKWDPPKFGHVPLLVDQNGQKLSKRNADIGISFFKDTQGISPAALVNFAALLGWSHGQKSDVFSLEGLEQAFNLKITRGNTVVSFEKLWFLQRAHAQRFAAEGGEEFKEMVARLSQVAKARWSKEQLSPILQGRSLFEYISLLLRADTKFYTNAEEFLNRNRTFFTTTLDRPPYMPRPGKMASLSGTENSLPSSTTEHSFPISALHTAAAAFSLVPQSHWDAETHRFNISSYNGSAIASLILFSSTSPSSPPSSSNDKVDLNAVKVGVTADKAFKKELYHYLRWALCAGAPGPGIPETMEVLGRAESVRRLQEAKRLSSASTLQSTRPTTSYKINEGKVRSEEERKL